MKQLYLFRHAKSDWRAAYDSDHARPLSKRGVRSAGLMGRFLNRLGLEPDLALTSTAVRARHTTELAQQAGEWNCPLVLCEEFYASTPAAVLAVVQRQESSLSRLLLTGHEPTWSGLVAELTGGNEPRMVTAAMARIDLPIDDWTDLRSGQGTLIWLVSPKLLRRGA